VRAELLKVRSLPAPRWYLAAVFAFMLIGFAATWKWGLGPDRDAFDFAIGFPLPIASTVFGVWLFGVEYGQNTMRRTLSADPRRTRLLLNKVGIGILLVALATVLVYLIAFPLYSLAADQHGQSITLTDYLDAAIVTLITNVSYLMVGTAFALITASMAGGVTFALVFIFIFGGLAAAVPEIYPYIFDAALGDIDFAIRGSAGGFGLVTQENSTAVAIVIAAAWLLGLLGLGWLRLTRSDVK